uniref:Mannosyl-3-phosphoglycerate phosphatase n=1 Tax=Candidatus Methanophagaceae archaeon ANME-1 ERB6 TaxID=2759912 RepID=A0A7G9YZS9_9EURY|nr:mannosyl-3-phosphoglycerate phosphatase [uncultured archaeon GZfos19C7]QNO53513.1 mannosyl-3-phosphoglycerate phosphatase [Methanosarcinales archaeon ANME-1 ERB6]
MKKVLFTDLDGTLLDLYDYSYDAALPALEALKTRKIPVVFCTAKTLVENEYYRKELGIDDPFIVENGGAIFVPENYFSFGFECKKKGDYCVVEFGALYGELRDALRAIKGETGFKITGFGDMTAEEVAADANLSVELAKLAKQKEYNESFIFDELESEAAVLFEKIKEKGFAVTHGGRYYNIHGKNADKGKAVRALTELFKREYGEVKTFGVGDSMNDISMLNAVEHPAVVKNKKGAWLDISLPGLYKAKGEGPEGWAEVVEKLLKQERIIFDNRTQMNADNQDFKYKELTEEIIRIFYRVYNKLGYGFLEKVYENAMMIELKKEVIPAVSQYAIKVLYEGKVIGEYYADILVENKVIVEIKAARSLVKENEAQLLNYLKATDIEVGLLVNFGTKPEVKRKAFDNLRK